jgi:hypothetical protein
MSTRFMLWVLAGVFAVALLGGPQAPAEPVRSNDALSPLDRFQTLWQAYYTSAKPPVRAAELLAALRPLDDAQLRKLLETPKDGGQPTLWRARCFAGAANSGSTTSTKR